MKITRAQAIHIAEILENMTLGYMSSDTLDKLITNINTCSKVVEDFKGMTEELYKRLYLNFDNEKVKEFFVLIKNNELDKASKYEDIYPVFVKHNEVLKNLLSKELEVDIVVIDEDDFIKGAVLGKKDISIAEIKTVFNPMFSKKEKSTQDFSELDELL